MQKLYKILRLSKLQTNETVSTSQLSSVHLVFDKQVEFLNKA